MMRAHPSQKPAAGCFHAREPESLRAARTRPGQTARASPTLALVHAGCICLVHNTYRPAACYGAMSLATVSYLAGRRLRSGSWSQATSETIGQTARMVAAANKTTGSSLTTVSPAVAHNPHTDERPDSQRCRPSRPTGLGNAGQSPSTLWMDRVGLRFVEKCAWSDIADGWTRRCRVTARRSACSSASCPDVEGHPIPSYPIPWPSISIVPSQVLPQPPPVWPRVCSSIRQIADGAPRRLGQATEQCA